MINTLIVKNFKSLKQLELDCRNVNILIGKPNTGKSNILESIGIFSIPYANIKEFVRIENMMHLFYDNDLTENIEITTNDMYCEIKFENGQFLGMGGNKQEKIFNFKFNWGYTAEISSSFNGTSPVKFYRFKVISQFTRRETNFLLPPMGENLLSILQTNKSLRKTAADVFSEYGLRIVLKPQEYKIEAQKEIEDVIISYPYSMISDTLQRVVFYFVAIETNKNSVIIFEEPEAHAFPYYTKFLAERISMDQTNQYFISTHNPYFLLSVLSKAPKDNIKIFITYYEDYQTKVRSLTEQELSQILDLDLDVFFNLDQFLGES